MGGMNCTSPVMGGHRMMGSSPSPVNPMFSQSTQPQQQQQQPASNKPADPFADLGKEDSYELEN